MKNISQIILVSFTTLILGACQSNEKNMENNNTIPTIPVEQFFRNAEKTAFSVSPNGSMIAYLAPINSRMNIFVRAIDKDSAQQITFETDRDINSFFWANDNRILFVKDNGGDENFKLYAVDRDGKNPLPLTNFEGVVTQIIDDLEENPNELIVGLNKRVPEIFDPYRLNIVSGELTLLAENPGNIMAWMTDHNGQLRIAITTDGVNSSLLYRETEQDEFTTVITTNFKESLSPLFFTFDNKELYAVSNIGRDKSALVLFDPKTGKEKEEIYTNSEVDIELASYSKKRKVLTAAVYVTDKKQIHFFDSISQSRYQFLESKLLGYEVVVTSVDKAENTFIIRTYSDKSLGAYYVYREDSHKLEKITDVATWIDEQFMADMKPVSYQSRDGLTIHGYLTLPKNAESKNLPVIVNPHGGPWARDVWGYNPEVQFLANRGYAVLQMNFRGSTGYGRAFWEASFKQWGQTMQNDITDGVNWLVDQGIADSSKVAIYGASYGGYATLSGVTVTPDLYACAVDYVGVSNLFTFMQTIPPYWKPFLEMMHEMVGDPSNEQDSLMMREFSPVFNVDKIKTPLFIAQGANDPRVNKAESDQVVEALKQRGVDVLYMVKDNEGHGFRNEENKFEFYNAMEQFLSKHLK
ncbi:MAG: S9 family peptidase [Bacteroidales bacterium]|nr:S9 family peptidase [Bacteroidales bacterium]